MTRSAAYIDLPDRSASRLPLSLARAVVGIGRSHFNPMLEPAKEVGDDKQAVDIVKRGVIERASVTPASTSTAASLKQTRVVDALSVILGPTSASGELFRRALGLSLDGYGIVQVPSAVADGSGVAFIAEGAPAPVKSYTFDAGIQLKPKKIMMITALTREVIESTNALALTNDLTQRNFSLGLESILLDDTAADDVRPAGLLAGISPIAATSGGGVGAMLLDLGALAAACAGVGGLDLMFIAGPGAAVKIQLYSQGRFPFPLAASSALDDTDVICIAPAALAVVGGDDAPRINVARETALHMSDDPQPLTSPGTPAVIAYPQRSLWQTDCVAVKLTAPIDWALRASGAIAVINGISW